MKTNRPTYPPKSWRLTLRSSEAIIRRATGLSATVSGPGLGPGFGPGFGPDFGHGFYPGFNIRARGPGIACDCIGASH